MAYLNTTSIPEVPFAARAASFAQVLVTRYKRHRLYRETLDALSTLSNRDLADLGLSRTELQHVSWEAAQAAKF